MNVETRKKLIDLAEKARMAKRSMESMKELISPNESKLVNFLSGVLDDVDMTIEEVLRIEEKEEKMTIREFETLEELISEIRKTKSEIQRIEKSKTELNLVGPDVSITIVAWESDEKKRLIAEFVTPDVILRIIDGLTIEMEKKMANLMDKLNRACHGTAGAAR